MQNRVVILGAGFSVSAGVPNQSNILNKILHIQQNYEFEDVFNTEIPVDKEIIQIFIRHLYDNISYERVSLEDLYTLIDQAILKKEI